MSLFYNCDAGVAFVILLLIIFFLIAGYGQKEKTGTADTRDPCPECESGRLNLIAFDSTLHKKGKSGIDIPGYYEDDEYLNQFEWACDGCGHRVEMEVLSPEPWSPPRSPIIDLSFLNPFRN